MTDNGHKLKVGPTRRAIFRHTPTIVLAEPFEVFLCVYSCLIGLTLLNAVFFNPTQPHLYDVLGPGLLVAWGIVFFIGPFVTLVGLTIVARTSALEPHHRIAEVIGLSLMGFSILAYGAVAPFRLPHSTPYQWGTLVLSILIFISWAAATFIRIVLITSPVFLLAVSRLTRIRVTKEEIDA